MVQNINKLSDLKKEKERLKILSSEQVKEIKQSLHQVKDEGKYILVKKILIPVGAAILAGYGLKKLIDILQSDEEEATAGASSRNYEGDPTVYHRESKTKSSGIFSNVNWAAMAVKAAPFILSVGKKLYEDGNLPFFNPPADSGKVDEV